MGLLFWRLQRQLPAAAEQDAGRLYGKVRITSEPYSNTILVTSNSKENLAVVEDVLRQLDSPSEAGESTLHVPLSFAKAPIVARNINILFAKNGSPPLRPATQQAQNNNNNCLQPGPTAASADPTPPRTLSSWRRISRKRAIIPGSAARPDNARGGGWTATLPRPVSDLVGRVRVVRR